MTRTSAGSSVAHSNQVPAMSMPGLPSPSDSTLTSRRASSSARSVMSSPSAPRDGRAQHRARRAAACTLRPDGLLPPPPPPPAPATPHWRGGRLPTGDGAPSPRGRLPGGTPTRNARHRSGAASFRRATGPICRGASRHSSRPSRAARESSSAS